MIRTTRLVIYIVVICVVFSFGTWFFFIFKFGHNGEFYTYRQVDWILNDSIRTKIDTSVSFSHTRERDVLNWLVVRNVDSVKSAYMSVWEFKDLVNVDLKAIRFDEGVNLDGDPFFFGHRFKNGLPNPLISSELKANYNFDNFLDVNINESSKIVKKISSVNYVGFYGLLNRMSFANEIGETQILFDYQNTVQPTLLLFYKARGSFFMILVNSDNPFDGSIINLFNLK
jgi:hypothetical protein